MAQKGRSNGSSQPTEAVELEDEGISLGTIIVSIAVITVGVLGVLAGIRQAIFGGAGFLTGAAVSSVVERTEFVQRLGGGMLFNGAVRLLTGIAQIVGGIGMFLMKGWGWWVAMIATAVVLIDRIVGILSGGFGVRDIIGLFGLIIPGVLLIILWWPSIRHRYL